MQLTQAQAKTIGAVANLSPKDSTIQVSPINTTGGSDFLRLYHDGKSGERYRWLLSPTGELEKED